MVGALLLAFGLPALALARECRVESGRHAFPLVEVYTSEGCDSCPPADRWLAARFPNTAGADAVPLAFHVDYWDRLGWVDRFAKREYTERQHTAAKAQRSAAVYTPQFFVQGRTVPPGTVASVDEAIRAARAREAQATIALDARPGAGSVAADVRVTLARAVARRDAALFVAYVDGGLVSTPTAGENRGQTLRHDHVVRDLVSSAVYSDGVTEVTLRLRRPDEPGGAASIVAFVQNRASGEVLQAVALALERCR